MASKIVLDLMPSATNNRNSEGSFIQLKDGRILFVYTRYGSNGGNDNATADLACCISADEGETWSKPKIMISRGNADNIMSVSLLRLQNGTIALLYLRKTRNVDSKGEVTGYDCIPVFRYSTDEAETWSDETVCGPNCGYYVVNNDRLIQLKNGRLMFPMGFHRSYAHHCDGRAIDIVMYSDDNGLSWQECPGWILPGDQLDGAGLQEPGLLELEDGRLLLWARTGTGYQYKAYSVNGGNSWTDAEIYTEFPSPCAPLSIKRNSYTGDLVAVWCDHSDRKNAFPTPDPFSWGRTPFAMVISHDDSKSWVGHQFVESASDHGYCYTAILFTRDNSVLLGYCCGGKGATEHCLGETCVRKIKF